MKLQFLPHPGLRVRRRRGSGYPWGWLSGAIAVVALALVGGAPTGHAAEGAVTEPKPSAKATNGVVSAGDVVGEPSRGPVWKEFRHPTGLRLRYPPDWQVTSLPSGLLLVPPDLAVADDGPEEAYLVGAESAAGISAPDDPKVQDYLNQQMQQLAPFMRRSGASEKIDCATTPGSLVRWEGRNPKGDLVKAQGYTTLLKGYGVVLFAIGKEAAISGRESVLRRVFASLAAGEGQKDPKIVGRWWIWTYSASKVGNFGTERARYLALNADGTSQWKSRSESSGTFKGNDSGGNEIWAGGIAGTSGDADIGTWSAGDGKLFVQWKDGSVGSWDYRVTGEAGARRLVLTGAGNKAEEWIEMR